jgi:hypothetical protein
MQSRTKSLLEQLANTIAGFLISLVILRLYHFPFCESLELTVVFTVVSVARGYVLRRFFNKIK